MHHVTEQLHSNFDTPVKRTAEDKPEKEKTDLCVMPWLTLSSTSLLHDFAGKGMPNIPGGVLPYNH